MSAYPSGESPDPPSRISTFNENPLHADLKAWYARPTDQIEVPLAGFIIDIVQDDRLVEIQTGNFSAIKRKVTRLTEHHPVRLVYPIAREKWIVKLGGDGHSRQSRRKSPKRGVIEHLFLELVSFPKLLAHPNFSLEVLLIQEEEIRRYEGPHRWRRKGWIRHERRLLKVLGQQHFKTPADLVALLPSTLVEPFTTADLATALAKPRRLAQKMAYCLREMEAISAVGKRGRAILYHRAS